MCQEVAICCHFLRGRTGSATICVTVARHKEYPAGSDEAKLHDAVNAYGLQRFFTEVAAKAKITEASARGTFYGYLRRARALPEPQKDAYRKILKGRIDPALLDHPGPTKRRAASPGTDDRVDEVLELLREIRRHLGLGEGSGR